MEFDMRSESAQSLDALDAKAQHAFRAALDAENARWPNSRYKLTMEIDTIGIRPTGGQPDSAPIVRVAEEAGKALGFSPRLGRRAPTRTSRSAAAFRGSRSTAAARAAGRTGWMSGTRMGGPAGWDPSGRHSSYSGWQGFDNYN